MESIHGKLLIGGMALKDLSGEIDGDGGPVHGRLALERANVHYLQAGQRYRLELDDGRAAQVVIPNLDIPDDHTTVSVEFDAISPLA